MCSVWLQRQGPCARNGHGPQWKHHPSQLNLNCCTWLQVLLQCGGSQPTTDRYTVDTRKFHRFRWHDWSLIILMYPSSMMRSSFSMFRAWKSPRKMEPSKGFNQAGLRKCQWEMWIGKMLYCNLFWQGTRKVYIFFGFIFSRTHVTCICIIYFWNWIAVPVLWLVVWMLAVSCSQGMYGNVWILSILTLDFVGFCDVS